MTEEEYLIHELAERAGVSVRTIRYYIAEGLLPPPSTRGRYAVYSESYIDRIRLIRLLKDRFLPLKEIQIRLQTLSPDEVKLLLTEEKTRQPSVEGSQRKAPAAVRESSGEDALNYIQQVLRKAPIPLMKQSPAPPVYYHKAEQPAVKAETWERISLAPGIELNLRQPVDAPNREKVDQLIQFARQLLR